MAVKSKKISRRSNSTVWSYEGQSFLGGQSEGGGVLHAGGQESFDSWAFEKNLVG